MMIKYRLLFSETYRGWQIDLYEDPNVKDGNGEPTVMRVLTIMLAEEY